MDNKALLEQLMGELQPEQGSSESHFLKDDACNYFSCWQCPHEMFVQTKAQISPICHNRHDACFPQQYKRAMAQYTEQRKLKEPNWDGRSDGDPWGFEYHLLNFIEREISRVEAALFQHGDRPDIYLNATVTDDTYQKLTEQINKLSADADRLVLQGQMQEVSVVLEAVNQLELKRYKLFQDLVAAQINADESTLAHGKPSEERTDGAEHTGENPSTSTSTSTSTTTSTPAGDAPPPLAIVDLASIGLRGKSIPEVMSIIGKWKLSPCPICGGLLSTVDGARKLIDHITGKMHLGYVAMWHKREELWKVKPLAVFEHPWRQWGTEERERQEQQLAREKAEQREKELEKERERERLRASKDGKETKVLSSQDYRTYYQSRMQELVKEREEKKKKEMEEGNGDRVLAIRVGDVVAADRWMEYENYRDKCVAEEKILREREREREREKERERDRERERERGGRDKGRRRSRDRDYR